MQNMQLQTAARRPIYAATWPIQTKNYSACYQITLVFVLFLDWSYSRFRMFSCL